MTEKPEGPTSPPLEKLMIDNPSDFLFHAAYVTYAEVFDKTSNPEGRKHLNQNIEALKKGEIDSATFYRNISQFRGQEGIQYGFARSVINVQRKKDWRKREAKSARESRHRR